jgi:hypothetical protein
MAAPRTPYLILGIPFGSSRDDANIAFARRAKSLRRAGAAGRDLLTDLTWALNQIDEGLRHPEAAMEIYRIPADPAALSSAGSGVLMPPPEALPPRPADQATARQRLQRDAAQEFLRYLVQLHAGTVPLPRP